MAKWLVASLAVIAMMVAGSLAGGPRKTCDNDASPCLNVRTGCRQGTCQCTSPQIGNPFLQCNHPAHYLCTVDAENTVNTFSGVDYGLSVPCRFLLADVRMTDVSGNKDLYCNPIVYGYGKKYSDGKVYLQGFDVRLNWKKNGVEDYISVKAFGNGSSVYDMLTRQTVYGGGAKWTRDVDISKLDTVLGGQNGFYFDERNNRIVFRVKECGVDIAFRKPADNPDDNVNDPPGLSVAISSHKDWAIEWFRAKESACLTPCLTPTDAMEFIKAKTPNDAMMYQVGSGYRKLAVGPLGSDKCTEMMDLTKVCTDEIERERGLRNCGFIFQKPFLSCFSQDDNSEDAIKLYNSCMENFCSGKTCADFQFPASCNVPACKDN